MGEILGLGVSHGPSCSTTRTASRASKQLHFDFGHAFWRTIAHLDYDRAGFPYPVVPFHVNCYGRQFTRGKLDEPAPPGPSPERCFELGAEVARFFEASPYRTVLIGSSSWSHGSLTEKHHFMWPDVEADRTRYEELRRGRSADGRRCRSPSSRAPGSMRC